HMAVRPVDPHVVSNRIPEALSAIIMKLLAKDAEDRYQSAAGLLKDFEECRRQWRASETILNFAPGSRDVSDIFAVSSKIYGRQNEKHQMAQAFRRVVAGAREFCLIQGFAGIGKSSVAFSLQDVVLESRGYFVSGKFDQYQSGIPYSGILKAFRQLINEILKEEAEDIAAQKEKLGRALGTNGGILTDVIPEIERLIGPQPEPIAVGPEEAENRFINVFQDFVRALARAERPLVLFIDDLHWADAASLRLLRVLLTATDIRYLMVLGAYRDNEVDDQHPLAETLRLLDQREVRIQRISMQALDPGDIIQLVATSLQSDAERSATLGNFIHQKTGGNPFFVREFLFNLYRNGNIQFDAQSGGWIWDADLISSLPAPDQIGELMAHKIQHLSPLTRQALQYAACMGARFDLKFLANLLKRTETETRELILPALREGLLSPLLSGFDDRLKDSERTLDATLEIASGEKQFQFQHDRVQQAAYDSGNEELRRQHHFEIATEWIRRCADSEALLDANIFAIVHHLDAAEELVRRAGERRLQFARLYLRAGRRALDSVAYRAAADALAAGIRLLPTDSWDLHAELTRGLFVANAEAQHLCSHNDACIELVQIVLKNTSVPLDRIPAYEVYLRALTALGEMEQMIMVALQALASLDIHLPANPGDGRALFAILKTYAWIWWKGPRSIITADEASDAAALAAMRIMALFASGAFKSRQNLYALAMCKYAGIAYRSGRSSATSYGLVSMAVLLVSISRFRSALTLSKIALELYPAIEEHDAKSLFAHVAFVAHWLEGLEKSFDILKAANRRGLADGDIEYGGYATFFLNTHRLYSTEKLPVIEADLAASYQLIRNFRNDNAFVVTQLYYQLTMNLRGAVKEPHVFSGSAFDKERDLPRLRQQKYNSEINIVHGLESLLLFLMDRRRAALDVILQSQKLKKYVRSMYFVPLGDYLEALIRLSVWEPPARWKVFRRSRARRELMAPIRRIRRLEKLNPDVYRHKWFLLSAEVARIKGKHERAARLYNQAIEQANSRGYLLDEALACELAGEFYLSNNNRRIGAGYIEDAYRVYQRWGALAKLQQLEKKYGHIFSGPAESSHPNRATLESTIAFATRTESGDLDIETVTKAVQMLFAGQNASAVMDEFLRLSVENAGAQRGALVLRRGDDLWLEALRDLTTTGGEFRAQRFESYTALPREIINYVLHSGESIVLGNALEEGDFTADPYVRRSRCKSILATPIVYDGDVRGVLYLENRLAANVLTRPRLQILSVLSHQAAVSLENARLYEFMQSEITEKTRQLLSLKLARDRMDPHFLFNSLNMVHTLMARDPQQANRALLAVADLYRTLTDISEAELVDFDIEWRFLEEYL
ncbi:MAG: AAA family ATPase, partial [Leptospirales bacterium]